MTEIPLHFSLTGGSAPALLHDPARGAGPFGLGRGFNDMNTLCVSCCTPTGFGLLRDACVALSLV
eukprot:COSAG06_NODE_31921_length_514_cov_0.532530_1_plen_64_part_01